MQGAFRGEPFKLIKDEECMINKNNEIVDVMIIAGGTQSNSHANVNN